MSSTCSVTDIGCWLTYCFDEIKILFVSFYGWFTDGIVSLINLIPVPDFLQNVGSYTLPSSIAFYAVHLELTFGISIIMGAYTLRFILRRIPFIG